MAITHEIHQTHVITLAVDTATLRELLNKAAMARGDSDPVIPDGATMSLHYDGTMGRWDDNDNELPDGIQFVWTENTKIR